MQHLPPGHPPLDAQDRAGVQQQLQRHAHAVRNVLSGRSKGSVDIKGLVGQCTGVQYSPDGYLIALTQERSTRITLLDANSGDACGELSPPHCGTFSYLNDCRWSSDSRHVVGVWSTGDQDLQFYRVEVASDSAEAYGSWGPLQAQHSFDWSMIALSPHGKWAAAAILDAATREALSVCVFDCATASLVMQVPVWEMEDEDVDPHPCWSHSGTLLVAYGSLVNVPAGQVRALPDHAMEC